MNVPGLVDSGAVLRVHRCASTSKCRVVVLKPTVTKSSTSGLAGSMNGLGNVSLVDLFLFLLLLFLDFPVERPRCRLR